MFKLKRLYFTITSLIALLILPVSLSFSQATGTDSGVLILAHGGSEEWNNAVIESAEPLKKEYKVEVAFGMANYVTMHNSIKKLEQQGVSEIAVIPLFISSYSPIIRQTEFLLGKRDSLADRPMPLMHHISEYKEMMGIEEDSSKKSRFYMPNNLQPIPVDAEITITSALDDHPVVARILNERIQELSTNPSRETVLLAAHGPNRESDNKMWICTMESLAKRIQGIQQEEGTPYKQIFSLTVRDDAPEPIFNQAKAHMRTLVRQAGQQGEVIVVPLFLSSGGREHAVAERLEELDFKWSGKTLLPDPLITDFLWQSAKQSLAKKESR